MNEYWQKIRKIHFDPIAGSPFWIKTAEEKNVDVFKEVHGVEDFWKLGILSLEVLRNTSPMDFLPESAKKKFLIPIESGGTAGEPILSFFSEEEFQCAFVKPFLSMAKIKKISFSGKWLYLGPTGPHAIGRAAKLCASALTHQEPYSIDFDPRWAKKLPADSVAAQRYLDHLCEQVLTLARKVDFSCLFVTPPILNALCKILPDHQKQKIYGIQLGGMDVSKEEWAIWHVHFPNAQFVIGYGNSLVGVHYFSFEQDGYIVNTSARSHVSIVNIDGNNIDFVKDGKVGQVMVHRLDPTILYLNLCERDQASIRKRNDTTIIQNVEPLASMNSKIKKGLY